jgi:hypothetical protein
MRPRFALILPLMVACAQDYQIIVTPAEIKVPENPPELGPTWVEDQLRQRIPERVDVLWVIDNSQSMLAEQQKLAENFDAFLNYYRNSGLDWQIGVVSTDMEDPTQSGRLQGAAGFLWTEPQVPDPTGVFAQMALLGRDGSAREQGRRALRAALSEPLISTYNAGFYRPDALLSIIMVSDENDFSTEPTLPAFVTWLRTLKPDPSMVDVSAIVGIDTECTDHPSQDYLDVVAEMGGVAYSICEEDWTPILAQLGIRAAGLQREFFLTEVPEPSTLEVWIDDEGVVYTFIQGTDFDYDGDHNSIVFKTYTPRASAVIHTKYATAETW